MMVHTYERQILFHFQRYSGYMSTTSFKNPYVLEIFLITKNF